MPLPLSVAIICKNNEATITRTLQSVQGLAAEIVAVDSGSTDNTIPILRSYGAKVIQSDWLGFARTKQKALEACTQEWVLCLDSDESLEPDLQAALRAALPEAPATVTAYELNHKVGYQGRLLHHAWQPGWRLRLTRRAGGGGARWEGSHAHEYLVPPPGETRRLPGCFRHDSFDTFEAQFRKQVGYARLTAQTLVDNGSRGSYLRLLTAPPAAFLKQLILKQSFRDGWPGWLAAATVAQMTLMRHALVIELARREKTAPGAQPASRTGDQAGHHTAVK